MNETFELVIDSISVPLPNAQLTYPEAIPVILPSIWGLDSKHQWLMLLLLEEPQAINRNKVDLWVHYSHNSLVYTDCILERMDSTTYKIYAPDGVLVEKKA